LELFARTRQARSSGSFFWCSSRCPARWLEATEIARLKAKLRESYWPLFAVLIFTGLRIAEAQGLLWRDVLLAARRIQVRERAGRRLKSRTSSRDVPIPEQLASVLGEHAKRIDSEPESPYGCEFLGDADLADQCRRWLDETANVRVHGTTRELPRVRFERDERVALQAVAERPYCSFVLPPERPARTRLAVPVHGQSGQHGNPDVERRTLTTYAELTAEVA
jgi:integrase